MKQVTLNLSFDSIEELSAFLAGNPAATAAKVASAQPSADNVVTMPAAPVAAAPAPVVAAAPAPGAGAGSEEVDLSALRSDLMGKLRTQAESMPDPTPLGELIHSFGVAKFSDLPDDQLVAFQTNLKAQFGV